MLDNPHDGYQIVSQQDDTTDAFSFLTSLVAYLASGGEIQYVPTEIDADVLCPFANDPGVKYLTDIHVYRHPLPDHGGVYEGTLFVTGYEYAPLRHRAPLSGVQDDELREQIEEIAYIAGI